MVSGSGAGLASLMRRGGVGPNLTANSVAKGMVSGSGAGLTSLMGGGRRSEYGHWTMLRTGVRHHGESCVPMTDDGDTFGCCTLPWKRLSIGSLPFV
jgi:hypothetical protein